MLAHLIDRVQSWVRPVRPWQRNRDVIPASVYAGLDWKRSAVAGSYALHQLTNATDWQPHDVDIMILCDKDEEFWRVAEQFERATKAQLVRASTFDGAQQQTFAARAGAAAVDDAHSRVPDRADEKFHRLVRGSRTYSVPNCPLPVQLICLSSENGARTLQGVLAETTDVPACVNYTFAPDTLTKVFHVPEKGVEALLTKRADKQHVCPQRLDKYAARGYDYY